MEIEVLMAVFMNRGEMSIGFVRTIYTLIVMNRGDRLESSGSPSSDRRLSRIATIALRVVGSLSYSHSRRGVFVCWRLAAGGWRPAAGGWLAAIGLDCVKWAYTGLEHVAGRVE